LFRYAQQAKAINKIADEVMSDEELDGVVGGGIMQTCGDNDFLQKFGYSHYKGSYPLNVSWAKASSSVDKGWSEARIICCTSPFIDNKYWVDGREISRKDAFRHVLRQKGFSESEIANYNFDQWNGSF